MVQSVVYRGMRWKWLVEFWPNEVGGLWLTKNHPDFDKSRKLLLDPIFMRVRLIIPDRKHPKYQSVELQFRRVYWQPILPVQSPCDMKLFQEILSKIELVDIYQTIDNEFQAHAIYFARRPTVFPKPILCEVKPEKVSSITIWDASGVEFNLQPTSFSMISCQNPWISCSSYCPAQWTIASLTSGRSYSSAYC